jgi:hypothetical protein
VSLPVTGRAERINDALSAPEADTPSDEGNDDDETAG